MSGFEHIELEIEWNTLIKGISDNFGDISDVKDVIFLIGVQELGVGFRKFSKNEKIDLMHIGLCRILVPFGYYEYSGHDKEGWPHYTMTNPLPEMSEKENEILLKQSVLNYFEETGTKYAPF